MSYLKLDTRIVVLSRRLSECASRKSIASTYVGPYHQLDGPVPFGLLYLDWTLGSGANLRDARTVTRSGLRPRAIPVCRWRARKRSCHYSLQSLRRGWSDWPNGSMCRQSTSTVRLATALAKLSHAETVAVGPQWFFRTLHMTPGICTEQFFGIFF